MKQNGSSQPVLVKDIMTKQTISVSEDTPVSAIASLLYEHKISGVPVVDMANSRKLVGIITEEDLIMRDAMEDMTDALSLFDSVFYLGDKKAVQTELGQILATKASELMTRQVVTIAETETVRHLAHIMMKRAVNPVPVLDKEGLLCGIVSRADIIRMMVLEQETVLLQAEGGGI